MISLVWLPLERRNWTHISRWIHTLHKTINDKGEKENSWEKLLM